MSDRPSFLDLYKRVVDGTKPCWEYHAWCMLATLSVFAGKRFWFEFGPYIYDCKTYVVLVGDAGSGKSSAMDRAKNIVRAAQCCPVSASQTSKEAMTQEMSGEKFLGKKYYLRGIKREYNQLAIFATEFTQFIGINPIGMLDFLTTVWSEMVYEVKTKHQGNDFIPEPYITMCACMTPGTAQGFLKQNILTSGFARRTAFVFSNTSNIVHIPSYTNEQKEAEKACVDFGRMLQTKSGRFDWTPELKDYYCAWNQDNEEKKRERPECMRGWYESKGEMLFKVSMLVALANEFGDRLVLDVPHYKLALHYCTLLEKNLERVFQGAGINRNAQASNGICNMLLALGRPMNEKHILAQFFDQATSANDLKDTITHLVTVGRIAEYPIVDPATKAPLGRLLGAPETIKTLTVEKAVFYFLRPVGEPPEDPLSGQHP